LPAAIGAKFQGRGISGGLVDAEGRPHNGANLDILHSEKDNAADECFLVGHYV
jgi:hypothetical protein